MYLGPALLPGIPSLRDAQGTSSSFSLLGDLPAFKKTLKENGAFVTDFVEPAAIKLGPIFQLVLGPFMRMVVISDTQEIENLLIRRPDTLEVTENMIGAFGGVLPNFHQALQTGVRWRKHRAGLSPSMTPDWLTRLAPRIASGSLELVSYWGAKMKVTETGGTVGFESLGDLQLCSGDILGSIVIGENLRGLETARDSLQLPKPATSPTGTMPFPTSKPPQIHQAIRATFTSLGQAFGFPPILMPLYWFLQRWKKPWASSEALVKSTFRRRIRDEMNRDAGEGTGSPQEVSQNPPSVLRMLLDEKSGPAELSEEELSDELVGYIIGGQDSIAFAMSWGLKFLSNNPVVQRRLRQELLSQLPNAPENRPLTYDDVMSDQTPYLDAVVSEILRCGKVAGSIMRSAAEDMVILGRPIPKGTLILMLTGFAGLSSPHPPKSGHEAEARDTKSGTGASEPERAPTTEDDTSEFKPERWLIEKDTGQPGETVGPKRWEFSSTQACSMPFGIGPRACFGANLGMLQLKIMVATLNLAFFFDKPPDELNSFACIEVLARQPRLSYIVPKLWSQMGS